MAKIPKQFKVVFKRDDRHEYDENWNVIKVIPVRLGFANVYEPNTKAYAKRKATQYAWAYGSDWHEGPGHPAYFTRDGKVWISRKEWVRGGSELTAVYTESAIPDDLQPIIIDNEPLEGFRIQKSVNRYTTSNKLWRIFDPRGFELEIPTSNMEELIIGGDISKGLILGKCVWAGPKHLIRV